MARATDSANAQSAAPRWSTIAGMSDAPAVLADHLFGFRGWALVLYGALPANLAVIGALRVDSAFNAPTWPMVGLLALPIFVTYLLIRTRQREWYVSAAFLRIRSLVVTLTILACSVAIYDAAQLAKNRFKWSPERPWWTPESSLALRESLLFSVASLVVSSTLFMTLLTKATDLPGLPSVATVTTLSRLRNGLRTVKLHSIWDRCPDKATTGLEITLKELRDALASRATLDLPSFAISSLDSLAPLVADLSAAVEEIMAFDPGPNRQPIWNRYFAPEATLSKAELAERQHQAKRAASIQALHATSWSE